MAENLLSVGETVATEAEGFMQSGAINEAAHAAIHSISRYSIFLKVLGEVQRELLQKTPVVIEKITIDKN